MRQAPHPVVQMGELCLTQQRTDQLHRLTLLPVLLRQPLRQRFQTSRLRLLARWLASQEGSTTSLPTTVNTTVEPLSLRSGQY